MISGGNLICCRYIQFSRGGSTHAFGCVLGVTPIDSIYVVEKCKAEYDYCCQK